MHRLLVSLVVVGVLALVPSASGATFEPNDSFNSAYGPLVAGTAYSGAFETENDSDYFFFYLPALTQMQYQLVTPSTNTLENELSIYQADLDGSTDYQSQIEVDPGSTGTGAVTLARGKYFAVVCSGYDCSDAITGDSYSFKLLPTGVTSTYEPFAAECAAARLPTQAAAGVLASAEAKLAKASSKLRTARNRGVKRKTIRKLRGKVRGKQASVAAKKASFEQAAAVEAAACSVPQ